MPARMTRARLRTTRSVFGGLLPFGHFLFRDCRAAQASALMALDEVNSNVAIEGVITGHE
jgi:hypothetical protein